MAPSYKLTYFNLMGLGEPIRFLFNYGGIEFEDVRVTFENWPTVKPSIPFGQLPILEVDGKVLNQSTVICRYLGKQMKLAGKNDWEDAEIDAMAATIQDMRAKMSACFYNNETEERNKQMMEVLVNETLPYYLEKFEAVVKANKNHFVGSELTWVDIFFVGILEYINIKLKFDLVEKYPSLKAMQNQILALPGIKSWIEKRPKTDF